jgi:CRISPR-associated protein Csm5
MVWKDHVNVLDQRRIFRLLAKGPRLDGYLAQLKKADKLDFASWGGFAQNFAGRRIPFEHASSIPVWERTQAQNLFIPTFAASPRGPYLPATAIKGALRTGVVFERWSDATLRDIARRLSEDRPPRNPAAKAEEAVLGGGGNNRMRRVAAADSSVAGYAGMKVYLLRVATLVAKGQGRFELGWKSPRGSSDARHVEESTPQFAEMAAPGAVFEGIWREKSAEDRQRLFQSANRYAASQVARHKAFAGWTGLGRLAATLDALDARIRDASAGADACVLSIGWGTGLLSKVAVEDTGSEVFRGIISNFQQYQKALLTGLPFPKTRRLVFDAGQPAHLPGWVLLEVL